MADADENDNTGNGNPGEAVDKVRGALASKEVLVPAALSAAAAVAAVKAPSLIRQLESKTEQKGSEEMGRLGQQGAQAAKDALLGGGGGLKGLIPGMGGDSSGGGGGGGKKTRRLPIERWTDVAVPIEKAYELWTDFEEFPNFMHRVLEVDPEEENTIKWREKIWFSTREWKGEITDRRKNDRIAWKTVSGTSHSGVISFHQLAPNLTRVMVTLEFEPTGMVEKMASGLRFVKRAVQSDLARFKAYAEFEDAKELEYPAGGSAHGNSQKQDDNDDDDEARENGRKQREDRRRERRQTAGAS